MHKILLGAPSPRYSSHHVLAFTYCKKKKKDRKVLGGKKLKGLKTLELSEVQGEDADRWRPRDGGANMRQ